MVNWDPGAGSKEDIINFHLISSSRADSLAGVEAYEQKGNGAKKWECRFTSSGQPELYREYTKHNKIKHQVRISCDTSKRFYVFDYYNGRKLTTPDTLVRAKLVLPDSAFFDFRILAESVYSAMETQKLTLKEARSKPEFKNLFSENYKTPVNAWPIYVADTTNRFFMDSGLGTSDPRQFFQVVNYDAANQRTLLTHMLYNHWPQATSSLFINKQETLQQLGLYTVYERKEFREGEDPYYLYATVKKSRDLIEEQTVTENVTITNSYKLSYHRD